MARITRIRLNEQFQPWSEWLPLWVAPKGASCRHPAPRAYSPGLSNERRDHRAKVPGLAWTCEIRPRFDLDYSSNVFDIEGVSAQAAGAQRDPGLVVAGGVPIRF